jgi:2-keto-4-pentenoate hydratase/2-oxohepta-3-ene-1,7-dioic acid hydratase in catechol pathway
VLADAVLPSDLVAILANGSVATDAIVATLEGLGAATDKAGFAGVHEATIVHAGEEVRLLSPLPRPTSLRDCSAYEQHVRFASRGNIAPKWYDFPSYYKGNPDSVQGTDTDVVSPFMRKLDYELEYAAVIGKRGCDIAEDDVAGHIAGYLVFNDVSARDLQFAEMSIGLGPSKGKDADGTNILGPYLVTPDEWDPHADNTMLARVNGEEWSNGSTNTIHFSVEQIVSYVSKAETIHVGDVIGTGTVGGGCGLELGRYPQPGDTVELEIHGLGTLTNRWVAAS